jgi:hypothetical protein
MTPTWHTVCQKALLKKIYHDERLSSRQFTIWRILRSTRLLTDEKRKQKLQELRKCHTLDTYLENRWNALLNSLACQNRTQEGQHKATGAKHITWIPLQNCRCGSTITMTAALHWTGDEKICRVFHIPVQTEFVLNYLYNNYISLTIANNSSISVPWIRLLLSLILHYMIWYEYAVLWPASLSDTAVLLLFSLEYCNFKSPTY